ncbi:MAG: hypothetical protein KUG82_04970 [Pseudomonadales bacterium]|nr:hypothetical protein [Pseudomonadales bacterium]
MHDEFPQINLSALLDWGVASIVETTVGMHLNIAVVIDDTHQRNHSSTLAAFYLASPDTYRQLLKGLQTGALNKSCCVQGNIFTAKSICLDDYKVDPKGQFDQAQGLPLCVVEKEEEKWYVIPPDIFDAMMSMN